VSPDKVILNNRTNIPARTTAVSIRQNLTTPPSLPLCCPSFPTFSLPQRDELSTAASQNGSGKVNSKASQQTKHVHINPADIKPHGDKKKMDGESAHTFAPSVASASGHYRRGSPVMITDALSDVRVNYHIDPKELGHGHYGVVRKCMHRESGEWYAIKSIRKSKVNKIEVLKREIEILKEVKHPNIIRLVEVYEDERYLHLITELCTGGELFDRIIAKTQSAEGHFSEHDAAALVNDILDAIRYCHEKKIVHRDLKPENFLFLTESEDAPVKIIDFGLSRHDDADLGIMQTKVGTPYYVAPEVLRREYTKSCDIWSIGVITYILLCGYPPFYGDSDTQIFESVRVGNFDFPSPEWDDISQSAKDFVILLLKKDPKKRYVTRKLIKVGGQLSRLLSLPTLAVFAKQSILINKNIFMLYFFSHVRFQAVRRRSVETSVAERATWGREGSPNELGRKDETFPYRCTDRRVHQLLGNAEIEKSRVRIHRVEFDASRGRRSRAAVPMDGYEPRRLHYPNGTRRCNLERLG